ncbi:MAG: AMP-binding protein [Burkholderiaceae bacterium]
MNDQHPVLHSSYQWWVPTQFNIAQACLQRWSGNPMEGRRVAIHHEDASGVPAIWSYGQLAETSNRLANGLVKMGIQKGERVAVVMSRRPEAVAACMAVLGTGAVLVPLPPTLGRDGLALRLRDAEVRIIIADAAAAPELADITTHCPSVQQLIGLGFQNDDTLSWRTLQARQTADFQPAPTLAEDPAILLYTAGTTGIPKGVLHAHRVLIGILPAFVASQNWYPRPEDLFWSPLDWSTAAGLLHGLFAVLYFGRPLVVTTGLAEGVDALALLQRYRITNTLLLPNDLGLMQNAAPSETLPDNFSLRAITVVGESVPQPLYTWANNHFGVAPNEMYGLTEAPGIVGHSHEKWPARPGSIGRPIPGHHIALLDTQGRQCRAGSAGQLALRVFDTHGHPDPCLFLSYWHNDALTQARYLNDWFLTGDMASLDEDGYYWFVGRTDDIFRVGSYRVSPIEIEDSLKQHPAVHNAAVVPKPEGARGNSIKAFVVLKPGTGDLDMQPSGSLSQALQTHVRARLASWQAPHEIEFVDRLPLTPDGQIRRHVLRAREQQRSMLAAAQAGPGPG